MRRLIGLVMALVLTVMAATAKEGGGVNLLPNPGAEEVVKGKPAGWGYYGNTPAEWGATEAVWRTGARSAFLKIKGFDKGGMAVTGIAAGETTGFSAPKAIEVLPETAYTFSVWVKGTGFKGGVQIQPWGFGMDGNGRDRSMPGVPVVPGGEWTQVSGTFTTGAAVRRVVLMCFVYAAQDRDVETGSTVYVDDVHLTPVDPADLERARLMRNVVMDLPAKLNLPGMWTPDGKLTLWSEIERRQRQGDDDIRGWVARVLKSADGWAARPDSYFVGLFRPETPFGAYTICCPIHPETSGYVPFEWDPDHPWRLTCPRCRKEGRNPPWYPNEQYADDGTGCRPTDEVWCATHDEAWGKKYSIPWERWDGITRGHNHGHAFYFLGHAQWRIFFELTARRQILNTLAQASVFAAQFYPPDSPEGAKAALYAHKAKVIMVTMTRVTLGDAYLRDAMGLDETAYRRMVEPLARDEEGRPLPWREYPGYRERDAISDHSADDPLHPIATIRVGWWKKALTIYPDHGIGDWSSKWLQAYAMIQRGFTSQERAARLHEVVERLLTVKEGDALRLEAKGLKTKAGAADLGLKIAGPFKMSGNLAGSMALARLNLAGMLNDKRIVRSTVEALFKYLREEEGGYFTTDGLGYETSPHYTHTAVGNLIAPFDALVGWKEGFGPGDPFWDNGAQALNPYLEPTLGKIAYSTLLSVLPDGRCAPWSDSWVTERPQLGMAEKVANATGRVPERFLPWLDVERGRDGRISLRLKEAMTLPSYVIPANGVAVMRLGEGLDQTFASVDWSRATGHSHDGPFNLLLYGARHEALCDQGYLNKATPTQDWMNSAEAHNTALVRTARGHSRPCVTWRGALRFFADAPSAKAVEVAEENQKKLSDGMPAGQQILFQRTVTLLATAGTPAGAYVVDIFRLQGGTTHDYYIHALGDRTDFDGVAPQPVADAALSLHEVSKFSYRASSGAKVITNLSTGRTDGAFTATWHTITDWRSMPPTLDTQAVTRVRLLAEPGTEVFLGQATGQRYMDGRDIAQKVNVLCARRNAEAYRDAPDAFVAVIDIRPDRNDAIAGVERLTVTAGEASAVGVKIMHAGGVDYVLSTTSDNEPTLFTDTSGKRELALTGRLGVVRIAAGAEPALRLMRGSHLALDGRATDRQISAK